METKEVKPACGACKWAESKINKDIVKCDNSKCKGAVVKAPLHAGGDAVIENIMWPTVCVDWWCDRFEPKEEEKTLADEFWKKSPEEKNKTMMNLPPGKVCVDCEWFVGDHADSRYGKCHFNPPESTNRPDTPATSFCSKFQAKRKK